MAQRTASSSRHEGDPAPRTRLSYRAVKCVENCHKTQLAVMGSLKYDASDNDTNLLPDVTVDRECSDNISGWEQLLAPDFPEMRIDDEIVVPAIWGFMMLLGLFGNLLVSFVMFRYADRSATNCFIVNLAVTDLAFTVIVIPLTMVHYVMPSWQLGAVWCKFHMYTIYVRIRDCTIYRLIALLLSLRPREVMLSPPIYVCFSV